MKPLQHSVSQTRFTQKQIDWPSHLSSTSPVFFNIPRCCDIVGCEMLSLPTSSLTRVSPASSRVRYLLLRLVGEGLKYAHTRLIVEVGRLPCVFNICGSCFNHDKDIIV